MFQKKLLVGAISVAALGLTSVALANGGGYGAAPVTAAPVAAAPAASDSSIYVGVGAGYADTHWNNLNGDVIDGIQLNVSKNKGFAGRVFAGYNFNRYLAAEAGWTYLPKAKFSSTDPNVGNGNVKNWAADLLGKVTAPVGEGFGLFAKAGLGYLRSKADNGGDKNDHFGPAYGVGASYDVMPNLVADISWMRYSGQGKVNSSNYQPNPDVALVSVAYKFPVDM